MTEYKRLELKENANHRKEEYKYFVGTTLKNPLEYEIGEKIIFKIRAKHMDDYLDIPYISYYMVSDDGQSGDGFIEKSEDGWFYFEASMIKSGFVYFHAKACDIDKQPIEGISPFNGSAGADVKNIFSVTDTPEDYEEFWNKLEAEVEATEPEVIYCEKIENNLSDFECYDMRIRAPWSDYVSLAVVYPKDAEPGSLKAVFSFQGYGVGSAGFKPRKGYLSVFVNAHCMPNRQPAEFYAALKENELKGYGFDEEENKRPESTYWAKMMLRDMQAIRFFKDHELINKKDYYFVGSSQGGMQACNMAAHFDRSSGVVLNVPWLADIYAHEIGGRRKNSMPKGTGVTYFDTAAAGQYLKCPVYIISGLGDATCNSSTQMALFNSIKSPKYIAFYQNKIHSCTIPWDENVYTLGDSSLVEALALHTAEYMKFD